MTEDISSQDSPGFKWGWVFLSLLIYTMFYFLPLMLVPGGLLSGSIANEVTLYVTGIWGTAGVFIIAAIMSYFSPGLTVWEVVVSAVGVVVLMVVVHSLEANQLILASTEDLLGFIVLLLVVFAMSYMGGWWGERMQNVKQLAEEFPMDIEGVEEEEEDSREEGGG